MKTTPPFRKFPRIYSHSFAARLTTEQLDELFDSLSAGLKYDDAAALVRGWMQANRAHLPAGARPGPEITLTSSSPIGKWFKATKAARRYQRAREAALAAHKKDPGARHALEQARYTAVMEGLRPTEIAAFERTELARQKLKLEQEKLDYHRSRDAALAKAQALLERAQEGEDLQQEIDLMLEEIKRMKYGDDYAAEAPATEGTE